MKDAHRDRLRNKAMMKRAQVFPMAMTSAGSQFDTTPLTSISEVQRRSLITGINQGTPVNAGSDPSLTPVANAGPDYNVSPDIVGGAQPPARNHITVVNHTGVYSTTLNWSTPSGAAPGSGPTTSGTSASSGPTPSGPIPSSSSSAGWTKAIAAGVTGAAITIIVGLIVFCILRRRRRSRAAHSAPAIGISTTSHVQEQRMSQSGQLSAAPRPFLDFPAPQNSSLSKRVIIDRTSNLPAQDNQGNIEPAVDPFKDPMPTTGNLSYNDDEGQRVGSALGRLQVLTSQFEGEFQRLRILSQSGQLAAEDRLKLEEIKRATGLTLLSDPNRDRISVARNASSGSSSSSAPPSYHTDRT